MDVTGKVAIITGSARGLGKAFAAAILEAGGKVVILDILAKEGSETEKEFKNKYGAASSWFIKCDVTKTKDLEACFKKTQEKFGRLDIVVNNAGIVAFDHSDDDRLIDINLRAVIKGTYIALEHFRKDKGGNGGVIINTGSNLGLSCMELECSVVYTATKHGVVGLTKSLALSIGDPVIAGHGVRLTCLCPNPVRTELLLQGFKLDDNCRIQIEKVGLVEMSEVASGFMKILTEEDNHGGILEITTTGTRYVHPEHLKENSTQL